MKVQLRRTIVWSGVFLHWVILLTSHNIMAQSGLEDFNTLSGQFIRVVESVENADTTAGSFYYIDQERMLIKVNHPINQIMHINKNILELFYPDDKRAFRIKSKNPMLLPLIPGLKAAIRPDQGMHKIGFEIISMHMHGDTVMTLWSNPEHREKIGDYLVAEVNDRQVYTVYTTPDSSTINRTDFSRFMEIQNIDFPTLITSYIKTAEDLIVETVELNDLAVNPSIPQEVLNFRIPKGIRVEKRRW